MQISLFWPPPQLVFVPISSDIYDFDEIRQIPTHPMPERARGFYREANLIYVSERLGASRKERSRQREREKREEVMADFFHQIKPICTRLMDLQTQAIM